MEENKYKSRHSGQDLDDAIGKILALLVNGKVDGTSVSFDNEEVSGTDSVALNKFNVQELLVNIIKKGVRSIDFSLANGRAYLRYNKLDGDYKTVPLPDADSTYYANAPTALKTAGAALADLYNKVAELQRGGVTTEQIHQVIQDWLSEHPEATTSIADGSITLDKLHSELKNPVISIIGDENLSQVAPYFGHGVNGWESVLKIMGVGGIKTTTTISEGNGKYLILDASELQNTITSLQREIKTLKDKVSALENGTPSTPEEPDDDEPTYDPSSVVGSVGSGNAIAINNDLGSVELYYLDANDNKLSNYDKIGDI